VFIAGSIEPGVCVFQVRDDLETEQKLVTLNTLRAADYKFSDDLETCVLYLCSCTSFRLHNTIIFEAVASQQLECDVHSFEDAFVWQAETQMKSPPHVVIGQLFLCLCGCGPFFLWGGGDVPFLFSAEDEEEATEHKQDEVGDDLEAEDPDEATLAKAATDIAKCLCPLKLLVDLD
jgi:hypothetical protein